MTYFVADRCHVCGGNSGVPCRDVQREKVARFKFFYRLPFRYCLKTEIIWFLHLFFL